MRKAKETILGTLVISTMLLGIAFANYATSFYSIKGECILTETGTSTLLDERGMVWQVDQVDMQTGDEVIIHFTDNGTTDIVIDDRIMKVTR